MAGLGRAAALGLATALFLAACDRADPTATDPALVFADGFLSDPAEVRIEAEGGTMVRGYDAWLVLAPGADPKPRYAERFRSIRCDAPIAYFSRLPAGRRLSGGGNEIECRAYEDPRLAISNGRWLVRDRRDGRLYFRVWKG